MKKKIYCLAVFGILLAVISIGCKSTGSGTGSRGALAIDTTVDPKYANVDYESKYVPPDGKVLLVVGQDKKSIIDYAHSIGVIPGGWASYWAPSTNTGITNDLVNGTEIQNMKWLADTYPNTVAQSAMWMAGKWDEIVIKNTTNGTHDESIDIYSAWANASGIPIYLRIGYEFDGPHNELKPEGYKAAYRYIVDRMRANGVSNIAYVWHSYAAPPYNGYALSSWYPGDDYVDWFAISFFMQMRSGNPYSYMEAVVDMALEHKKPVMIAEATPIGGIAKGYETWNNWFVTMFSYAYEKNIKAISYINCDWDRITEFEGWGWGDTRIQRNPRVQRQWLQEINKDRYLKQSSTLFDTLGY